MTIPLVEFVATLLGFGRDVCTGCVTMSKDCVCDGCVTMGAAIEVVGGEHSVNKSNSSPSRCHLTSIGVNGE